MGLNSLSLLNPWWKDKGWAPPARLVERDLFPRLLDWMQGREIIGLVGARQVGKSTLMKQLIFHLIHDSHIKSRNILYINLDLIQSFDFFRNPLDFISSVYKPGDDRKYIFLDEVQRLENPGIFLKAIHDLELPVKIIISGSSSIDIKGKTSEPLTGRKLFFNVQPFSLAEIGRAGFSPAESIDHFMKYGSYPGIVFTEERNKLDKIRELFDSYLYKDIQKIFKIENLPALKKLVLLLAHQAGNMINKSELASHCSIHRVTLDNYIDYLQQVFVLDIVPPFYGNARNEIVKAYKIFFNDPGLYNFAVSNFSNFDSRPDKGQVFENFIHALIRHRDLKNYRIRFWRTKQGAEVDFVLARHGDPIPVECKASAANKTTLGRSFHSFISTYKPRRGFVVNLNFSGRRKVGACEVFFVTPFELRDRLQKDFD